MAAEKLETLAPIFELLIDEGVGPDSAADSTQRLITALEQIAGDDLVTAMVGPDPAFREERTGIDGFVERWVDWLSPFQHFRLEIDEIIDQPDRLVTLVRQYAIPPGGSIEIEASGGAIWTFEGERLVRADFILNRQSALDFAGIDPESLESASRYESSSASSE
jgi:hypothetical protein